MPADFDKCAKEHPSKVRTMSGPNKRFGLKADEYMHICIDPKTGEMVRGYVKKKGMEHKEK